MSQAFLSGVADQSATSDAWVIKEKLRCIQKVPTPRASRWRITNYLKVMKAAVSEKPLLEPMGKALATLERHADAVARRWISGLMNARLEGMSGLFQAAKSRALGYRNEANFIAMIYLIGSPRAACSIRPNPHEVTKSLFLTPEG